MQRYFTEINNDNIIIEGEDFHHIKNVMRMKPGHKITVCDKGECYLCELDFYEEKRVHINILSKLDNVTELPVEIHLAVGLLKGDKFDLVIQKATELGITKVIPLAMKRSIVKLDEKKETKKVTRWQKIAKEAAEQSKRQVIPVIERLQTVDDLFTREANIKLFAYEETDHSISLFSHLQECKRNDIILIVVGPEGGIDAIEVNKLKNHDFKEVSLGKRILRAETAALHFVGVISAFIENKEC